MANSRYATWLFVVFLMNCGHVCAVDKEQPPTINVTGEAEIRVVPNEVVLTLGVETWDYNLDSAKSLNDACVKAVIDAAKAKGVEEKDIQTDYLTIEPQYLPAYKRASIFTGYFVRQRLVIDLRDVAKFLDVLTDILQKGRTAIPEEKRGENLDSRSAQYNQLVLGGCIYLLGAKFCTTELPKYREEAHPLAVEDARKRAVTLADELGKSVGKPKSVTDYGYTYQNEPSWYSPWWGSDAGNQSMAANARQAMQGPRWDPSAGGESISLGKISIKARINVTFELIDKIPQREGPAAEK